MTTTQNIRMSALYELEYETISPEQKVMNRLKPHMKKGFKRKRQTKYYCQLMKIPIQQLDMLGLKYWGCFVSETFQSRLFSQDIIQLIFNITKIQNIPYQLGFTQPLNFNTWFKGYIGVTPCKLRKKMRLIRSIV